MDLFSLSAYQYDLPAELIAQQPVEPRDASRLMILDRAKGEISEIPFREIAHLLNKGDGMVFNNTKVIPSRFYGRRTTGGFSEIFLIEDLGRGLWKAMARPVRKLKPGARVVFSETFSCEILEILGDGIVKLQFDSINSLEENLCLHGKIPLPHYIDREPDAGDKERYQTVYASVPGAVAAPTAGLHFTPELLERLSKQGISLDYVTLHVGLGTFKPVTANDIREHRMHEEKCWITPETAESLNALAPYSRRITVGTTCCRALEAMANEKGCILPGSRAADIFIYPGYRFKYVKALLTNFHLPGSTLLMLVSAFGGYEFVMEAYRKAVKERFRFFSYGDAMLIL